MVRFWLRKLARQFRSSSAGKAGGQRRDCRPAPRFEYLEDRITPSTLDFTGGVLSYTASAAVASNFTLSFSGSTYTLSDTAEKITVTAAARAAGFTGSGTNTVTGPDSNALNSLQINLGNSNDTANVRSFSKPTSLTTGAGNDTINVSSTSLTGNLNGIGANLTIDAGAGANTLNVSDYTATSGNQNVVVGNSSITGFAGPTDGATINYAATGGTFSLLRVLGSNTPTLAQTFTVNNPNASLFQLNADNGTNAINVEAISGTASIVGGLGKDNIVVSSKPDLTGSLDNIKGTLNIDGGQGVNTLTVSDAGTAGPANNAVITATQITGFAGANNDQTINYKAIGGSFGQIHLIGADNASLDDQFTVNNPNGPLVLDTGAGDDVVNVQALSKAATINGGAGDDTFNVSSDAPANLGTLNGINGGLTVNAGSGSNVLDVSDYGQTSLTDNVTVTPSKITGFAGASKGTVINYAGTFSSVILSGSNADGDTFTVSGNTVAVLQGNGGNDTFNLDDGAAAKSIDGGAGTDTLNYGAYTANVNVTLAASSNANGYQSNSATGLSGGFAGIDVLIAGSGPGNTLTGENVASTWTLGSTAQTYNDGGSTSLTFSAFQTLDGGTAADTFNVNAATAPVTQINGGDGNDVFNVNHNATANLDGNGGNDTFNIANGVTLTGTIDGGGGSDTLSYAAYTSPVAVVLSGSDATGLSSTSATGLTGFEGIDVLVGGQSSGDSLTGENVASTWALGDSPQTYSDGSATLDFSAFETVNAGTAGDTFNIDGATDVTAANGGAGNDVFNVNASAALNLNGKGGNDAFNFTKDGVVLTGSIDGGSGSDTLSYAGYKATAVAVTLTGSDATGLSSTSATGLTGFKGIDVLVGGQGSSDSLTGENVASTWALGASPQTYSDGSATLDFSAFETVNAGTAGDTFNIDGATDVTAANGGSGDDTFNVNASAALDLNGKGGNDAFNFTADGVALTGSIDGGGGTDTLSYAGYTSAVAVTLTGSDATGLSSTSATGLTGFKGIDVLVGGSGSSDSLTGENVASTWALGASPQTYSDGSATLGFSAFETVNAGTAGDTFNIDGATDVTAANGGAGNDVFNVNASAALNLNGKGGNDAFNFTADGVALTGSIDGGTGTDTLSYAGYTSAVAVTLTGSDATGLSSTSATGVTGFEGIDVLVGGQGSSDSLTGENVASTWTLGNDAVMVGGSPNTYSDGSATLGFSAFETVNAGTAGDTFNIDGATDVTTANGGSGDDTFNVNASASLDLNGKGGNDAFNFTKDGVVLTGSIDGGSGSDTLSYAGYKATAVAVTLTGSDATGLSSTSATGVTGFEGIDVLVGGQGSSDSLTGENVASTWALGDSPQTYGDGSATLGFSAFETVNAGTAGDTFDIDGATDVTAANGGSGDDTFNVNASAALNLNGKGGDDAFNLADGVTLTGTIDGGTGSDTLSYAAYKSAVAIVLSGSSATTGFSSSNATGLTGFAGIDVLTGGQAATDTLTGENKVSTWDVGTTQDYRDGTATLDFSAFEHLQGGSAADTFNITAGNTPVTQIDGGDGNNIFNVSASATMDLSGGKDNDTFNLGDGVVLTGSIDGDAGTDTLNYAKYTSDVAVVLTSSGADGYASSAGSTGVTSFQGIDVIAGGKGSNDTLTGENVASTWNIGDTQTYDDGAGNGTLTFSAFETLSGGSGNDTFNVTQTSVNVPLTLLGNDGDNVFNVSNLAGVQGDFTIDGGNGGNNSLNVDDTANTTSVGWVIDSTSVQQFNAGIITYGNIAGVTVTTGTPTDGFSNALDVEGVAASSSLTVVASQTDVTVAQVAGTLAGIQGGLIIDAAGSNVTVTVNDSQNTADTNYTINGVTGTISTDTVSITVLDTPTSLVVLGGSGTNTFDVTPSPTFAITVDGGSGGNNTLTYHYGSSTTWSDDGSAITDPGVVQDVIYSSFNTVNHVS